MTNSGASSRRRRGSKRSTPSAQTTRSGAESPKADFEELFACFAARRVRYLIVGGYAVAFHAKPRFTKDIDLWIDRTRANADRVLAALRDFGAPTRSLRRESTFGMPSGCDACLGGVREGICHRRVKVFAGIAKVCRQAHL
jgi:hypothetical protein